jgi:putative glutamine amidotransferase|tara:strand:- start:53 stop:649 length:597 start_codon:yes stop_codon:yes gene_type:complete
MKIGIVPRIRINNYQIEYCLEKRLIDFLKKIYKNNSIISLDTDKKKYALNMLIISGGNDLTEFQKNKENLTKKKISKFYLKDSIKKNIPVLGICYGAQFIAKYFNSKLISTKKHVGNHNIEFLPVPFNSKLIKVANTNSFHNYLIKKTGKNLQPLARTNDNSIEAFRHLKYKIYGIMWHPERNKVIKKFDIQYFKKFR